jgi:Spy/CpxP family protein refolding chaperone
MTSVCKENSKCKGRGKVAIGILLVVALVIGGLSYAAYASPFEGHFGKWRGHHEMTVEDVTDYANFFVKRFSKKIDATPEQTAALEKTLHNVIPDMMALKEKKRAIHKQVVTALSADKVDRVALEKIRAQGLKVADEASKLLVDTTASVSEILTPDQRAELMKRFEHKRLN